MKKLSVLFCMVLMFGASSANAERLFKKIYLYTPRELDFSEGRKHVNIWFNFNSDVVSDVEIQAVYNNAARPFYSDTFLDADTKIITCSAAKEKFQLNNMDKNNILVSVNNCSVTYWKLVLGGYARMWEDKPTEVKATITVEKTQTGKYSVNGLQIDDGHEVNNMASNQY